MSDHGKFGENRPGYIEIKMPHPEISLTETGGELRVYLTARIWSDGTMLIPWGSDSWIPSPNTIRVAVWNHLRSLVAK